MNTSRPSHLAVAPGFRGLVAPSFENGARRLRLDTPSGFDRALAAAPRVAGGRGPNALLESAEWPGRVRLRFGRRGGIFGPILGDRFLTPRRSEREFLLWRTLESRGAPIPSAVMAIQRRQGLFWRSFFASREIEGAVSLSSMLDEWHASGAQEPRDMRGLARSVARAIRRLHDAGALHGDLHLGNILLDPSSTPPTIWLVDLDRARPVSSPAPAARMRELMRLVRSILKAGGTALLTDRLRSEFLAAYCAGDRSLRDALLAHLPREQRRIHRHRIGWRWRSYWRGLRGSRAGLVALATLGLLASVGCFDAETPPDHATSPGASASPAPSSETRRSLLTTGDTGSQHILPRVFEGQRAVAHAMVAEDRRDPVDAIVLLGDNFYWHGLDRAHLVERIRENLVAPYCHFLKLDGIRSAEVESACTVAAATRHPIPIYAVLGNHDLELPESAALQREIVPDFVPGWRMSEALTEVIELDDGISLILFESEVAIRDRKAIERALLGAIDQARGPWRILATHRPIATNDDGGPSQGGYPDWVRAAIARSGKPVQLVLAAHHHSLQAFALPEPSRLLQVGVGSGSQTEGPLAQDPPGSLFGALELGFARIDLVGSGAEEHLRVTLFGAPRWPWLSLFVKHEALARFRVDRAGHVEASLPTPTRTND